jgi:hypothetical protein
MAPSVSITPEAGYSVLGWNHPGFYGSTGVPLPSQASTAIEIDTLEEQQIEKIELKLR